MKLQKVIVGFSGIVISVIIGVSTASAAWVSCSSATIKEVAILPDLESETTSKYGIKINCDDVAWAATGDVQFLFIPELGASAYAMALTAIASGKKVKISALSKSWNALATRINIIKD